MSRPLKFETVEDLKKVVDEYFEATPTSDWTVTGLALVVGSKQLLNDYETRDGYKEVVIKAKLMVENSYEIGLKKVGGSGFIFALKNFGWTDKSEREVSILGFELKPPSFNENKN